LLLTLSLGAFARVTKPFSCKTTLEYKVNGQFELTDLIVEGARSKTNTLVAIKLWVRLGGRQYNVKAVSHYLSNDVVVVQGGDSRGLKLKLVFMNNSNGSQNLSNAASLTIKNKHEVFAADNGDNDIDCEISK
jgi:hypothetical protein